MSSEDRDEFIASLSQFEKEIVADVFPKGTTTLTDAEKMGIVVGIKVQRQFIEEERNQSEQLERVVFV